MNSTDLAKFKLGNVFHIKYSWDHEVKEKKIETPLRIKQIQLRTIGDNKRSKLVVHSPYLSRWLSRTSLVVFQC